MACVRKKCCERKKKQIKFNGLYAEQLKLFTFAIKVKKAHSYLTKI